jgi:hypothetical protein
MKLSKRLIKKDNSAYEEIGNYIQSKESVVGIDAKHTHIIIIKKLIELEEKLEAMEKQLRKISKNQKKSK